MESPPTQTLIGASGVGLRTLGERSIVVGVSPMAAPEDGSTVTSSFCFSASSSSVERCSVVAQLRSRYGAAAQASSLAGVVSLNVSAALATPLATSTRYDA